MALNQLDPALDAEFVAFYSAVTAGALPNEATFDAAADAYFATKRSFREHDAYFENFTPLWRGLLDAGRHVAAASVWPWALRPVLTLEATRGIDVHKGTPYYFWGMTSLLAGNLQDGYLQMHRALEEDNRTHGTISPNTPGFALATLDATLPDQAFRPWVQAQAAAVERRLSSYRASHGRKLDLPMLRTRLLADPTRREWTQTYCFATATAERLLGMPPQLWDGFFSAQLGMNVLFDLCLVVDATVHEKNLGHSKFSRHAEALAAKAGLGLSFQQIGEINGAFINGFEVTLRSLLAGTFQLSGGQAVTGLAASLAVTYGCRNRAAHDLGALPLSSQEFEALIQAVNECFFLAVEVLYP